MAFVCNYLPSVIIFNIFTYLSPSDRLRASATCKTWRDCIYNCSQWPQKSLSIDLLRRTTSVQTLRRNKHNKQLKPTIDSSIALKSFLHKCCRFLNQLVITFDPNSTQSLNKLIQILDILLSTEEYNYNDNNNLNDNNDSIDDNHCVHNSRSLRRLTLNPVNVTKNIANNNNENNTKVCHLLTLLVQRLEQLIQRCDSLEHISMGCLQSLLNHSNRLLQMLAKRHSHSLKCLHLASVKTDPDFYPVVDLSVQLLEPFASLRLLSIDFDSVSDQMLRLLARKETMDSLVINVHGIDDDHEGLSKSSWNLLTKSNPDLKVTVNLIHTDDSYEILRDSLFDTDMPLTHFRAYFVGTPDAQHDETICYLVTLVTDRHSRTLQSVTLVNALKPFSLEPNPVFAEFQENPLVMLSWRSRHLHSLTIIGYEVCDTDLIAITRLRGSSLKHFEVPMCCISLKDSPIVEDEGYFDIYDRQMMSFLDRAPHYLQSKVINEIAGPLGRNWYPIQFEELPRAVINRFEDMQTTYLSTILKDQTICGESHKTSANSDDSN